MKTLLETCNEPECLFKRTKTNLLLADIIKSSIMSGSGRLSDPLKNGHISILKILDAIKSQECIKVANYKPDRGNKHLKSISLGPSYLEQQISKAIDKASKHKLIPSSIVPYIRFEIGLDREKKTKPQITNQMKQKLLKRQLKEEIEKIQDLPDVHVPIELPPLRQSENFSCGATVIQMVSSYYGKNIRESDLIDKLGIGPDSGVKMSKIQSTAKDMGFLSKKSKITYEQIIDHIDNKIPLVLAILRPEKNYHHFVLAVGYYDGGLVFRDPAKMNHSYISKEEFENRAFGSDNRYLTLSIYLEEEPQYSPNRIEKI